MRVVGLMVAFFKTVPFAQFNFRTLQRSIFSVWGKNQAFSIDLPMLLSTQGTNFLILVDIQPSSNWECPFFHTTGRYNTHKSFRLFNLWQSREHYQERKPNSSLASWSSEQSDYSCNTDTLSEGTSNPC